MSFLEIVLIILIAILILMLSMLVSRRRKVKVNKVDKYYAEGLNDIINENYKEAIKKLRFVVERDTDNIDAYIKLGLAYRVTGDPKGAVKVHMNLLYREEMSKEQKIEIIRNLVEDFVSLGNNAKAIEWCEKILEIDNKNKWAIDKLWNLYPASGAWNKAIELLKMFPGKDREKIKRRASIYKTAEGIEHFNKKEYHEARLVFKKAIKYDERCEAPYYYIAESYYNEGRVQDAIIWWEKYFDIAPEKSFVVFNKLEKLLFELGNFDRVGDLYEKLHDKLPNDIRIVTNLALFYEKKGKLDEAIDIIDNLNKSEVNNILVDLMKAKLLLAKNDVRNAQKALDIIIEKLSKVFRLRCSKCGNESEDVYWICPVCNQIDTYINA